MVSFLFSDTKLNKFLKRALAGSIVAQAKKWNPQLNFDPEEKARELQKQGQGK
jgi:hypothetical protein